MIAKSPESRFNNIEHFLDEITTSGLIDAPDEPPPTLPPVLLEPAKPRRALSAACTLATVVILALIIGNLPRYQAKVESAQSNPPAEAPTPNGPSNTESIRKHLKKTATSSVHTVEFEESRNAKPPRFDLPGSFQKQRQLTSTHTTDHP